LKIISYVSILEDTCKEKKKLKVEDSLDDLKAEKELKFV